MKTIQEYAADAAARLKKSPNGSMQQKNEKLKSLKPQKNVPKPAKRPTGRGK